MKKELVLLGLLTCSVTGYKVFSNEKIPHRLPESEVRRIYSAIAGEGKFTVNGPRAYFLKDGINWTIVGANAPIVNPTVYPKTWPVKGDGPEILVIPDPITNYKILPFSENIQNAVKSDTISITAAKGEYEPASFVIRSGNNDIENVTLEVTDLNAKIKEADGKVRIVIIPKQNIDIRVVKCWYQSGIAIDDINNKILVPELLLHDDELVRVDYDKQINIIKDFNSLEDAETLQIFKVPRRQNKQIWLTVHVPQEVAPGEYRGLIKVTAKNKKKCYLKLFVKILPFEIPKPILNYSLYYLSRYSDTYTGRPVVLYKNDQQMLFELKDMLAHGINNPTVVIDHEELIDGKQDLGKLAKAIKIRKKAGITDDEPLLYVDWKVTHKDDLEKYKNKVKRIIELANKYGIKEVYIYGKDEASGEELKKMQHVYKAVHEIGGKNFVAGWLPEFLRYVCDVLDIFVVNGMWNDPKPPLSSVSGPTQELVRKAKKLKKIMYIYNSPQICIEEPATYRKHFGFNLWAKKINGTCNYAYQEGDPWDDFNSNPRYRSHTISYPTQSGRPIPTLQWEGWREGVDDVKYLTLLIEKKTSHEELKSIISIFKNPYKIRKKIVEMLLKNE